MPSADPLSRFTSPSRYALLLVVAAVATLGLKFLAFYLSGSIGIFSDAAESFVNLTAASFAAFALAYAAKPADREHAYGHEKIEYFASGIEGALIVVTAGWIIFEAVMRFLHPRPLATLPTSLVLVAVAAGVNGIVAWGAARAGRRWRSIILSASAQHLAADVWTTLGIIVGLLLYRWTDRPWLDPLLAALVALHVIRSGSRLVQRAYQGLMDRALEPGETEQIRDCIRWHLGPGEEFHALRTRQSGARRFVDFHLLVPGARPLTAVHALTVRLEKELTNAFPGMDVTIHMEPVEEESEGDGV
ncbi:MAG: cation transporter [Deltaproteobacteria bacterium]|nr:cation transporter [Deltaproteobacteria bacterium]